MPSSSRLAPIELPTHALDVPELAALLGCCHATVRRERERGRLHGFKLGNEWRFRPEDVQAYLDGQTPASTAERVARDAYIRKVVANAPPLSAEQVAALSALFDSEPDQGGDDAA
jgi:excisionase family DNA binding protein